MTDIDILLPALRKREPRAIARTISLVEDGSGHSDAILSSLDEAQVAEAVVLGITGPPGAGKSTLTNQLITAYRSRGRRIGIIAVDPSSPISGGALLGDRLRMMQHAVDPDVIVRSMGEQVIVGVNKFQVEESGRPPLLRVDPAVEQSQIEQLSSVKKNRNYAMVSSALTRLQESAQGTDNLMPPILEAVREYATLGEICAVLREVFGEYRDV